MPTRHSAEHERRRVEFWPDRKGLQTRLRLLIDGEEVGVERPKAGTITVAGGGALGQIGDLVLRARELVVRGADDTLDAAGRGAIATELHQIPTP